MKKNMGKACRNGGRFGSYANGGTVEGAQGKTVKASDKSMTPGLHGTFRSNRNPLPRTR